jgi:hypothetical protein
MDVQSRELANDAKQSEDKVNTMMRRKAFDGIAKS